MTELACHRIDINAMFSKATEAAGINLLFVFCALVGFCREGVKDESFYDGLFVVTLWLGVLKEVCTAPNNRASVEAAVERNKVVGKFVSKRVLLRRNAKEFTKFLVSFIDVDAGISPLVIVSCHSTRRGIKSKREAGPSVRYRSHGHRLTE